MRTCLLSLFILSAYFVSGQAETFDFPNPVDTNTKPTFSQERETRQVTETIYADNQFKSARLNGMNAVNDTLIEAYIEPENTPINLSPWYAFRLWSTNGAQQTNLRITYADDFKHRYWPKFSSNGQVWSRFDSLNVRIAADTSYVDIQLTIPEDTIWIAAQPIIHSGHVKKWVTGLAENSSVKKAKAGKSTNKRTIPFMQMTNGSPKGKDIIVCLSRQHPPEVTGFLALQHFLDRILSGSELSNDFLDKYVLLVYPLLNPDGVDEGHWRHGVGGIDLNRDWAYYHQPETRAVANHIVKRVKKNKGRVILGLDFHSTYYDVYYTTDRELDVINGDFTDKWLDYMRNEISGYEPHDAARQGIQHQRAEY